MPDGKSSLNRINLHKANNYDKVSSMQYTVTIVFAFFLFVTASFATADLDAKALMTAEELKEFEEFAESLNDPELEPVFEETFKMLQGPKVIKAAAELKKDPELSQPEIEKL